MKLGSWFSPPQRISPVHLAISALFTLVVLLVIPDRYLLDSNLDLQAFIIFGVAALFVGCVSSRKWEKSGKGGIDPFYIRACWCFFSGLVAIPVCLIFRHTAVEFAIMMLVVGLGTIVGNQVQRAFL